MSTLGKEGGGDVRTLGKEGGGGGGCEDSGEEEGWGAHHGWGRGSCRAA